MLLKKGLVKEWGEESREGEEREGEERKGEEREDEERFTSAMVTLPAFAMGTLKFLADFLKTRFPLLSAFHALMSAKSAVMASSMM